MARRWFEPMTGRTGRLRFLLWSAALMAAFALCFALLQALAGRPSTLLLYPFFFYAALALAVRRLHDRDRSALWLAAALVPIAGPLWLGFELCLRRGTAGVNRHGPAPGAAADYQSVS